MRALKIKVNFRNGGQRAGGLDKKREKELWEKSKVFRSRCYWQTGHDDVGYEIRLVVCDDLFVEVAGEKYPDIDFTKTDYLDARSKLDPAEHQAKVEAALTKLRNGEVPDVELLEGEDTINAAITATIPETTVYKVTSEALMNANIVQAQIDLSALSADADEQEELEFMYNNNISGIKKIVKKPLLVSQVI